MNVEEDQLTAALVIRKQVVLIALLPVVLLGFVVYQSHAILTQTLREHDTLQAVDAAVHGHLLVIQHDFMRIHHEERHFVASRSDATLRDVAKHVTHLQKVVDALRRVEGRASTPRMADKIMALVRLYLGHFEEMVQARKRMGTDQMTTMVQREMQAIRGHLTRSPLTEADGKVLLTRMGDHEKKVLAWVKQRDRMDALVQRQEQEAMSVQQWLEGNVHVAMQHMERRVVVIRTQAREGVRFTLILGGSAFMLAVALAFFVVRRFVGDIKALEGMLKQFSVPVHVENSTEDTVTRPFSSMGRMILHLKTVFFQLAAQGESLSVASLDLMFLSKELHDTLQALSMSGVASNKAMKTAEKILASTEQIRTLSGKMEEQIMILSGISGGMEISLGRH